VAVSLPAFFRTRKGIIAAVAIAIILIGAIFAVTWTATPNFYTGLGLRPDASLENYVNALHAVALEQHPQNLTAWSVAWLNSTAVRVSWAYTYLGQGNETSNQTRIVLYSESFIMTDFFGTNLASAYVKSINSTYKLMITTYGTGGAYDRAFGHAPSTFADYQDTAGHGNFIWQFDQFVQVGSLTRTYSA
jgi:hypothetical protein